MTKFPKLGPICHKNTHIHSILQTIFFQVLNRRLPFIFIPLAYSTQLRSCQRDLDEQTTHQWSISFEHSFVLLIIFL